MTRLIKRYPNRKLYDTVARRYIALRDIATLVRQGVDLRVVEHKTNEDVTARTLSQIILKQQRHGDAGISHSVLASLVRAGERSTEAVRTSLATSWSAVRWLDEELQRRASQLVEGGLLTEAAGERVHAILRESIERLWAEQALHAERALPRLLWSRLNLASRQDVQDLEARIEELAQRIDELRQTQGPGDQ